MAHQGSFSSVAAVQLRDVWYHSQCRLQEEKNTIRRQEKRKISDTPPPSLVRPVMDALAFLIGRLR